MTATEVARTIRVSRATLYRSLRGGVVATISERVKVATEHCLPSARWRVFGWALVWRLARELEPDSSVKSSRNLPADLLQMADLGRRSRVCERLLLRSTLPFTKSFAPMILGLRVPFRCIQCMPTIVSPARLRTRAHSRDMLLFGQKRQANNATRGGGGETMDGALSYS